MRRFEREARLVGALNHPNVMAVYDVGNDAGTPFVVTELLEGETLRERLAAGRLAPRKAAELAFQIAQGLAAAHARGIVHRDLKPENLFLARDGLVKILDFGIAKAGPTAASETQTLSPGTVPGAIIGTPGYLAPEQARGLESDARSDIFALGAVLAEMIAGRAAFARSTIADTLSAILYEDPPTLPSGTPPALVRIVQRCLEKAPDERFASARDLGFALDALGAETPASPEVAPRAARSVAVLPFVNDSGDPDIDYLSDGVAESLLDAITRLPHLRVVARSTVMRFKDRAGEPTEVGRALGVSLVVTGHLSQRGDALRIACELVRVEDGARLWGRQYERRVADLLTIREEIGEALIENLRGRKPSRSRTKAPTRSEPAYQAYLRGRHAWNRWTADAGRAAIRHYEEAIALDPSYALAWAGLADAWATLGQTKAIAPADAFPKSKAAARHALEIDPQLAEAYASLGFVGRFWDWDWDGSARSFRRAIELAPSYATAHRWYGHLFTGLGRHDEALTEVRLALEYDPLSLVIHTSVGDALFYARRYEESIEYYRRALELDPEFLAGHSDLARALEYCGRTADAVDEYERAIRLVGTSMADPSAGLANVLAVAGRSQEARAMLDALSRQRSERYVSPWALASIHARLGEASEAFMWLERAYDEHDSTLVWLKVHPRFDSLRDEPRFRALLSKMHL